MIVVTFVRLLAFLDVVLLTSLIGKCAATGAHSAPNQGALTATSQPANYRATHRRAADNLRSRMMPVVTGLLFGLSALVLSL